MARPCRCGSGAGSAKASKDCPNAAALGLNGGSTALTTDMNATAEADETLNAAEEATANAANAVANAQEAIRDSQSEEPEPSDDEPSFDVNNDGGE